MNEQRHVLTMLHVTTAYIYYLLAILASSLQSAFPTREQGYLAESYDQARGNVKNSGYLRLMALRTALVSRP